jgi:hypothetical protein
MSLVHIGREALPSNGFSFQRTTTLALALIRQVISSFSPMGAVGGIDTAQALEKEYRWLDAANVYARLIATASSTEEKTSLLGRRANALFRSAFQVDTAEEYRRSIRDSAKTAEDASTAFKALGQEGKKAHYLGIKQYLLSFLTADRKEAAALLEDSGRLFDEASIKFSTENDKVSEAESQAMWLDVACWGQHFPDDPGHRVKMLEEGEDRARRALKLAEETDAAGVKARVLRSLGGLNHGVFDVLGDSRVQVIDRAAQLLDEAMELCQHDVDAITRIDATCMMCYVVQVDFGKMRELAMRALSDAESMRDKRFICLALNLLLNSLRWRLTAVEDLEKAQEMFEEGQKYASRFGELAPAVRSAWTTWDRMSELADLLQIHRLLAEITPDLAERRRLLEPAIQEAVDGMNLSDHRFSKSYLAYALATAYRTLAVAEPSPTGRHELLGEAVKFAELQTTYMRETSPAYNWNIGVGLIALGGALYELSILEKAENRKELLHKAAVNIEEGLVTAVREPSLSDIQYLRLGRATELSSKVTQELRTLQADPPSGRSVPETLQQAIEFYQKSGQQSRIAEAYWKIALEFDALQQFSKSLDAYDRASNAYRKAAESIPVLSKIYGDYADYMQGWKAITVARIAHEDENYNEAEQRYLEAAETFGKTAKWAHLKSHYSSCALLERAENYSKLEDSESSLNTLKEASATYEAAHSELLSALGHTRLEEEKVELAKWVRLTESRKKYSVARATIEEAKLLDQSGQRLSSARKFQDAAELLEGLVQDTDMPTTPADRSMVILCRAWAEMKQGESEQSPQRFENASKLFTQAKEVMKAEKAGLLALGNASLCQALAMGTQFISNFSEELFIGAKKHLETAANHYLAAGYTKAASWVRATERLFDAFVHLSKAEAEVDADKRALAYSAAEKYLESARTLFSASGYSGKREETERYLTRAREERELLLQPLSMPGAASFSATASRLNAPTLTRDKAIGVERFEGASLLANCAFSHREGKVGETIDCELEIVNLGNVSALLVKVEDPVPTGCELVAQPEHYRFERNTLELKGKKLDPFQTEKIKLKLKLREKGTVRLNPKVYFVDERGAYQSNQAEPAELEVRELGISGWFKGPTKP